MTICMYESMHACIYNNKSMSCYLLNGYYLYCETQTDTGQVTHLIPTPTATPTPSPTLRPPLPTSPRRRSLSLLRSRVSLQWMRLAARASSVAAAVSFFPSPLVGLTPPPRRLAPPMLLS